MVFFSVVPLSVVYDSGIKSAQHVFLVSPLLCKKENNTAQ